MTQHKWTNSAYSKTYAQKRGEGTIDDEVTTVLSYALSCGWVYALTLDGSNVYLTIKNDFPQEIADDIAALMRIFGVTDIKDITIPGWDQISVGCETCAHGAAALNGTELRNAHPKKEVIKQLALVFWQRQASRDGIECREVSPETALAFWQRCIDIKNAEIKRKLAEERAERERKEQKRRAEAEARRQQELKAKRKRLLSEKPEDYFDPFWEKYQPHMGILRKKDLAAAFDAAKYSNNTKWVLFKLRQGLVRCREDIAGQTRDAALHVFQNLCQRQPAKMLKILPIPTE